MCLARRELGGRCWVDGSATHNNVPRAPRYTDAHMALALLNDLSLLNFKAAERGYRDTIALDPARPSCHYNLGVLIYGKVSGGGLDRASDRRRVRRISRDDAGSEPRRRVTHGRRADSAARCDRMSG